MPSFVAWLRGINVGKAGAGRKSVPMAELRELAAELRFTAARTHLQSGNLVFAATGSATRLADQLEAAIEERFGFAVPVVVSTGTELQQVAADHPFPDAADERPQLVHIAFCRARPGERTLATLLPYCKQDERCAIAGRHLWIDFPAGVARSKLTPAVLDRAFGAAVTMRNSKTLRAVLALLES